MGPYYRMRKKGPALWTVVERKKQTLRCLLAARGVKPGTLCGARCSATLEYISSMTIVQCRNRCRKSVHECYGSILGDHTCSDHDFPDSFPRFSSTKFEATHAQRERQAPI